MRWSNTSRNDFNRWSNAVSKTIAYSAIFNAPVEPKIYRAIERVRIAQEFGWTLDYVDSLSELDKATIFGVLDGQRKLEQRQIELARQKAKTGKQ